MNKIDTIRGAVLDITLEDGYQNLSIAKIAKKANVSPATIYIYYQDKEDMLTSLYASIKELIDDEIFQDLSKPLSIKEKIWGVLTRYFKIIGQYPKEAFFMQIVNNNPSLVKQEVYDEKMLQSVPLMNLFEQGIRDGVIKDVPIEVAIAHTFFPINAIVEEYYRKKEPFDERLVLKSVSMCWDAIKA